MAKLRPEEWYHVGAYATVATSSTSWNVPWENAPAQPKPQPLLPTEDEHKHLAVMRDFDPGWDAYWEAVEYFRLALPPSPWIVSCRPAVGTSGANLFPGGSWLCKKCGGYNRSLAIADRIAVYCCKSPRCIENKAPTTEACQATWLPLRSKSGPSLDSQRENTRKALAQIWEYGYQGRDEAYGWLGRQLGIQYVSCWHMNPEMCAKVSRLVEWYLTGGESPKG